MGFFDFFRSRSLATALNQTYKVKVHGVVFVLRKLNPIDYMAGLKALQQPFDTYKTSAEQKAEQAAQMAADTSKKMREHFSDVFLAAVVEPKLVRKFEDAEQGKGIWVDNLFSDWELANDLYLKIMEVSYGKKKMKQFT